MKIPERRCRALLWTDYRGCYAVEPDLWRNSPYWNPLVDAVRLPVSHSGYRMHRSHSLLSRVETIATGHGVCSGPLPAHTPPGIDQQAIRPTIRPTILLQIPPRR